MKFSRPTKRIAAIATVILAGSFTYGAVQAAASGDVEPSEALIEAIPALGEPQTATDELPGFLVDGEQELPGISADSVRELATHDGIRIWTAVNDGGEGCLISLLPGPDQIATLTCASADAINEGMLTLASSDGDSGARISLTPPAYDADDSELESVGDQILIGDPAEPTPEIEASDGSGDSITIPAYPGIGQ